MRRLELPHRFRAPTWPDCAARGDRHGRRRGSRRRICAARRSAPRQSAGLLPGCAHRRAADSHRGVAAEGRLEWPLPRRRGRRIRGPDRVRQLGPIHPVGALAADRHEHDGRRTNRRSQTDRVAPGVGHCGGGDGPSPVGLFDALVNWVEKGIAPDTVPATRRRQDGSVMSRPLCAYPAIAKWTGRGSTDDAANVGWVDAQHQTGDFSVADPPRN
jgi:hypothetical protein